MDTNKVKKEVFGEIKQKGLQQTLGERVYLALGKIQPATTKEVWAEAFKQCSQSSIVARFNELKNRGLIVPNHKRNCQVSGATATVYVIADQAEIPEIKTRAKKMAEMEADLAFYKDLCVRLKAELEEIRRNRDQG